MAAGIACVLFPLGAAAVKLGDAEVRSFAGQALDVRIAVEPGADENVTLSCFSARAATGSGDWQLLSPQRFRLDETLRTSTLIVRSYDPFDSVNVRLEVTARCSGESGAAVRTYELRLLTVQSLAAEAVAATPLPAPVAAASAAVPALAVAARPPGVWRVRDGDTLRGIAVGIYPKSPALQSAFIARLRLANNAALPADDAPLTPAGSELVLPDLVALANESPRLVEPTLAVAAATSSGQAATKESVPAKAARKPSPAAEKSAPVKPAPAVNAAAPAREAVKPAAKEAPARASTPSPAGSFSLRLSGSEMDLSRSRGITETTRATLREKQLILDADDQVAALLSLKNTVKQLESRLTELQLKLSTTTLPPAAKVEAKPPEVKAAAPVAVTPPPAQSVQKAADPAPPVAPPPAAPTPVAPPASKTQPSVPKAAPAPAPAVEEAPWWQSIWVAGGAIGALLLVLVAWLLNRRRQPLQTMAEAERARSERESGFSNWANAPSGDDPTSDMLPQPPVASANIRSMQEQSHAASAPVAPEPVPASHQTMRMQAPMLDLGDDQSASLELDTRPATSVDFILGDDVGEDKARRQRYMEERYPEMANRSISVDEPDSIIDAARHYFEDGQLQKATELLTYAFEERPGQLRFWLALFEIHRLEQKTADFAELAARFKNVHGGTDAWPKVQHIGRDLDPGQPLYAAALGRLGVGTDAEFDPVAENWLNVPMDFTSDALMVELRNSILAEHQVGTEDLRRTPLEALT